MPKVAPVMQSVREVLNEDDEALSNYLEARNQEIKNEQLEKSEVDSVQSQEDIFDNLTRKIAMRLSIQNVEFLSKDSMDN